MKKVIDRKVYDTETATELTYYSNNLGSGDFGQVTEKLYRTKNGALFLHGEGGGNTQYAEHFGNSRSAGSDILPKTENEVIQWMEDRGLSDEICELFPDAIKEA